MNNLRNSGSSSTQLQDFMLLLSGIGSENAEVNEMIAKAKKLYVDQRHTRSISQIHSRDKYRDGRWKTYVYIDGQRKSVEYKTKEEVYDYLYQFYRAAENAEKTFQEVFEMLIAYKRDELGRKDQTIREDIRHFGYISESIRNKPIHTVTEGEIRKWLVKDYLSLAPKQDALKKTIQLIKKVFDFGRSKKLCITNPAEFIMYSDYANRCDLTCKSNEEKSFSDKELSMLKDFALSNLHNPRAVMMLVAMETGLRVGELSALKKTDVVDGYLHVHRQQLRDRSSGHQEYSDVGYTKNERERPKGGRFIPITPACAEALKYAANLAGESEYLFHDKKGKPIQKDTYLCYLRRKCTKLGIDTTNNHAFRVAFNRRLCAAHLDDTDRALILGHSVETNERHYSFSDQRRLDDIKKAILDAK
jgi:Phage integrase family.